MTLRQQQWNPVLLRRQNPTVPFFCYCCGKPDHGSNKCNHKGKPKSEWYINKVAQHHHQTVLAPQAKDSKGDSNKDTSKEDNKSVSFSDPFTYQGCTLSHTQMEHNHSGTIALDTGSMIDVFGNPDLVNNIHQVSKGLLMQTNSGTSMINTQADVPGLGKVWFKKDIPTNIVGMANLVDHPSTAYITYDSREADQFNIHHHSGNVTVFKRTKDKLYTHTPKQLTKGSYMTTVSMDLSSGTLMNTTPLNLWVSTVNENKKNFTDKQFQQAVRARKLYHIVGAPTADNFKYMLKAGAIINCPVKSSHVDLAKRIFGEDIATLKGKSTRNRSPAVTVDQIEVPKELIAKNQDLELHIDVMYVNQEAFLTSIDMPVRFRTANYMDKVNKDHFYTALDRVLRKYNAAGFYVRHIHADSELQPIMDEVKDGLDVTVHVAAPDKHVPPAERNNRTIKERTRVCFHRLPYAALPVQVLRPMVMQQADKLNLFPVKGGISAYHSPRTIITGEPLEYDRHCKFPFGSYVTVSANPNETDSKSPKARSLDCIYLRPPSNHEHRHQVLHLATGSVLHRATSDITELPVTDSVIKLVETMAERQGFQSLKFKNRHKVELFPADWIAGVDYDDPNIDDNYDQDEDIEDADYDPQEVDPTDPTPDDDQEHDLDEDEYDDIDPDTLADLQETTTANPTNRDDEPADNPEEDADEVQDAPPEDDDAPDDAPIVVADDEDSVESNNSDPEEPSEDPEEDDDDNDKPDRRISTRATKAIDRLNVRWEGQSYMTEIVPKHIGTS